MIRKLILLLALLMLPSASVFAAVTMHTATTTVGNQAYNGVGLVFNVDAASGINVIGFGIYDSGQDGIIGSAVLSAVLYDNSGTVINTVSFNSADSGVLSDNYLWKDASLYLAQGQYTLMGYGFDAANKEHNMNINGTGPVFNGGGLISFVESRWGAPGSYPTHDGAPDYFSSANMSFTLPTVPAPAALLLGLLGTGLTAKMRRRKLL